MPKVNNEPKPKKPKQVKRPTIKRNQKALITQDNRLIYSRYGDMTTNELKVFYWIISKLNPMTDQEFKKFEIPISELFTTLEHKDDTNHYTYIRKLCQSLGKRTFTDDTLSIDPITGKEINGFFVMPIFQILHYTDKQAVIYCELNKYIRPYLLGLKERFTSIPLDQILHLRSNYAIRIYQMLLSEIKQNRKFLRLNLAYLQNTLEVPKSFYDWGPPSKLVRLKR
ncbi:replication initiation protein [Helicobacter pylori]|uniref:replication initiation protein n=1 Tax=Helicobacter pylori TaxID=210 RepID=UPI0007DAED55|nr:replication initiation protein [Helicobacter pylori]